jgi:hypothetical protein
VGDPVDEQVRVLLAESDQAIAGKQLVVKSVTMEWFTRDGIQTPRLTLVLEPSA